MSTGLEYMSIKDAHDSVLKAAKLEDREQIQRACKAFWNLYDSLNLDSGIAFLMKDISKFAYDVSVIDETKSCLDFWHMS